MVCRLVQERGLKNGFKSYLLSNFPTFTSWFKQEWGFIIDFTVYILSAIIATGGFYNTTLEGTLEEKNMLETYFKPCWVWRMTAVNITMAWINLLLYIRELKVLGKYIIILNDIIYTFLKFVVIFIIFVLSFAFGFQVLLKEGGGGGKFDHFKDAFMKTMIMMSGEFDYGDIFFPENEDGQPSSPPFPDLTFAFFTIFFILLALLLMNLLLGLTLNDVEVLVEVASIKKMSIRLKFCLNLERIKWKIESAKVYIKSIKHKNLLEKIRLVINSDQNVVIVLLVKLRIYKIPPLNILFNQINDKTVEKLDEDKGVQVDPKSRMWKQVIRANDKEDKKNEIEELQATTNRIEQIVKTKLKEIDDQARDDQDKMNKKLSEIKVQARQNQVGMIRNSDNVEQIEEKLEEMDDHAREGQRKVENKLKELDDQTRENQRMVIRKTDSIEQTEQRVEEKLREIDDQAREGHRSFEEKLNEIKDQARQSKDGIIRNSDNIDQTVVEKLKEMDDHVREGQRKVEAKLKELDDQTRENQRNVIEQIEQLVVEKLRVIDYQTKEDQRFVQNDYEKRKHELQNMMEDFKTFIISQTKRQENEERSKEDDRTLHIMGKSGKG